jgi:hypothetical protein
MAKAKDINIYKIFSETYNRSMFGFMGFGELKLIPKVDKPIRQTISKVSMGNHVDKFIKERQLTLVVNNGS